MKDKRVYQMCVISIIAAMVIVLDLVKIELGFLNITFYAIPLLICGIFYGPAMGALAGLIAGFIIQMTSPYGISVMTPLWMLSPVIWGGLSGLLYKAFKKKFSVLTICLVIIFTSLIVTGFNSFVIWLDGIVMCYPTGLTVITILLRFTSSLITSVLYTLVAYYVIKSLRKSFN